MLGPVLGVAVFEVLKEELSQFTEHWYGILGIVFILCTIFLPNGIAGLFAVVGRIGKGASKMSTGTGVSLQCENIQVAFGGLKAVAGVSRSFQSGRIYGLIGPNGAGKTTLMNALSGHATLAAGQVILNGRDITKLSVHARTRAGLGRSFQITKIFAGMTVLENLKLAAFAHLYRVQPFWKPAGRFADVRQSAEKVLEQIGLERLAHAPAENLSHGDQRALEVGLALLSDPSVLLLDEPLAGVGHERLEQAIGLIRRIVAGRTVLLIEHNMDVVMQISDEIVVMVQGATARVRFTRGDQGEPGGARRLSRERRMSALALQDCDVFYGKAQALHHVSIDVAAGEVVSLIGRNGAGKSTLLKAAIGLNAVHSGRRLMGDRDVTALKPHRTRTAGPRFRAGEPADLPEPDGRGKFEDRDRDGPQGAVVAAAHLSAVSRGFRSVRRKAAIRCPAASSRCWRSAAGC